MFMSLKVIAATAFLIVPTISSADVGVIPGEPYNGPGGVSYGGYVPTPGQPYNGPVVPADPESGRNINEYNPADPCRDGFGGCGESYESEYYAPARRAPSPRPSLVIKVGDTVRPAVAAYLYTGNTVVGQVDPTQLYTIAQIQLPWIALRDEAGQISKGWIRLSQLVIIRTPSQN